MRTLKLLIEYDGTNYHGWQVQEREVTIQGVLEEAVCRLTGERLRVHGASRTDAGVHAFGQVAAFRTTSALDAHTIRRALNALLPRDVRICGATDVHEGFHPRDDAVSKRYFYILATRNAQSAFTFNYAWALPFPLDHDAMEEAARYLVGRHDFSAFMGSGSDVLGTIREVYTLQVERMRAIPFMTLPREGEFLKITVEANGFLRHMVRTIVGTLVEVGRKKWRPDTVKEILDSRDRRNAGQTAPARGLFLENIRY